MPWLGYGWAPWVGEAQIFVPLSCDRSFDVHGTGVPPSPMPHIREDTSPVEASGKPSKGRSRLGFSLPFSSPGEFRSQVFPPRHGLAVQCDPQRARVVSSSWHSARVNATPAKNWKAFRQPAQPGPTGICILSERTGLQVRVPATCSAALATGGAGEEVIPPLKMAGPPTATYCPWWPDLQVVAS